MRLFKLLWRKWVNYKWLTISTWAGLVLVVAFTTSIPMYADGALKRVITKTLFAVQNGMPAGSVLIRYQRTATDPIKQESWSQVNQYINQTFSDDLGLPKTISIRTLALRSTALQVVDFDKTDASKRRQMAMMAMSDFANHIDVVQGAFSKPKSLSTIIPVMVLEDAIDRYNLRIGDQFDYKVPGKKKLRVQITGVFKPKNENDPYWYEGMSALLNGLFVDESWLENTLIIQKEYPLNLGYWFTVYDLQSIQSTQIAGVSRTLQRLDREVFDRLPDTHVDISFQGLLDTFRERSNALQALLLALALPMIMLILVFIVISAQQSAERQRTEFAVLQSRGASFRQLTAYVLLDAAGLGVLALIAGIPLGFVMAKSIGAANGFLEFVQRQSIPVGIGSDTIFYGTIAVVIAVLAYSIPVILNAKTSIVRLKQQTSRNASNPFWHRFGIDIIFMGVAGYGYYMMQNQQWLTEQTGLSGAELQLQPVLFMVPALAIAGMGLFTLRLLPYLLRLLTKLNHRWLPVSFYLTSTQLSRSTAVYYPVMLLLMLTIGLGIYNAAAARTMDTNSEDRVRYQYGTDVQMTAVWESVADSFVPNQPKPTKKPSGSANGASPSQTAKPDKPDIQPVSYNEPPYEVFGTLQGVEATARVLKQKTNAIIAGRSTGEANLMALDNVDFAKVAWFRRDLYPVHPFYYLKMLGDMEEAVIVSSKWAHDEQVNLGDTVTLIVDDQPVELVVSAMVDYWPSLDPRERPFFIANLDYVYDQVGTIPYTVWMKMKTGAPLTPIIEQLQQKQIILADVLDVRNALITQQKLPSRGGVFGILSMGFLLTVIVSFLGYILFWVFALSKRVVQLGILRASGLSKSQLTGMLLFEQLLTSGTSIGLGLLFGQLVSKWFLPFLQTTEQADAQLPPFRIVFEAQDTIELMSVVLVMILVGFMILNLFIRRLRIHQAVKLGEER